jgi:hypothetical protein
MSGNNDKQKIFRFGVGARGALLRVGFERRKTKRTDQAEILLVY